ncbi:MAG: signal recognition particle-docking protein FtsY [Tissierellia bacterium]|nr:signal recognition particle-docking protein FtsY [Tissierellia bacterium]
MFNWFKKKTQKNQEPETSPRELEEKSPSLEEEEKEEPGQAPDPKEVQEEAPALEKDPEPKEDGLEDRPKEEPKEPLEDLEEDPVSEEPAKDQALDQEGDPGQREEPLEEEPEVKIEPLKEAPQEKDKLGFFGKLKEGLQKTSQDLGGKINRVLGNYVKIDDELLEDLEDILITADVGMETTLTLIDNLRDRLKEEGIQDPQAIKPLLADEISRLMAKDNLSSDLDIEPGPALILVIGVNGVGKTTTIGKLAHQLKEAGKSVLIVAADTFRAAAIEQLQVWGERTHTEVIRHQEGADPASVIYDGIAAAKSRKVDVLICDTAGRLHNKSNLMQELEKINRVIEREYPQAKKEVLLVLDATTGQNALIQAKTFNEVADITGIVLTKLDGTAKGGVVIGLQTQFGIPIKFVGVGEKMEDLQPFKKEDFAKALLDLDEDK